MVAGDWPEEITVGVRDLGHIWNIERLVAEVAQELAGGHAHAAADIDGGVGIKQGDVAGSAGLIIEAHDAGDGLERTREEGFCGVEVEFVDGGSRVGFGVAIRSRGIATDGERIVDFDIGEGRQGRGERQGRREGDT